MIGNQDFDDDDDVDCGGGGGFWDFGEGVPVLRHRAPIR